MLLLSDPRFAAVPVVDCGDVLVDLRGNEHFLIDPRKHVSPPRVAPHPRGAAVDLTLWARGAELDLGAPINATPAASDDACFTAAPSISDEARALRGISGDALGAVERGRRATDAAFARPRARASYS